jgi:hypothetical protein
LKLHRRPLPADRPSRRSAFRPRPGELHYLASLVLPVRRLLLQCQRVPRFQRVPPFLRVRRSQLALRSRRAPRFRQVRRCRLEVLRSVPRFRRVLR